MKASFFVIAFINYYNRSPIVPTGFPSVLTVSLKPLLIQLRERDPREITMLIDKSFSLFGAWRWKLKEGEQGCSEPIVAGLVGIG